MMSQRINDMPDWLKPLYENNAPNASPSGSMASPTAHSGSDMPDWLAYAYQQQGSPDAPQAMPDSRLTVKAWLLVGEPSDELAQHLGSQRLLLDNVYLNLAREALAEAEKQIRAFFNQRGVLPDAIDMYKLRDVAEALKMYPVQVATLLVDTILIASGEYETCPSDMRHRAILGISQRILDYEHRSSMPDATERMAGEVLEVVEQAGTSQGASAEVRLHARKLLLGVIARGGSRY
ncbi:MAG: hypothetical protein JXJ17_08505 [Anaerolineae bacterium]|nr:hypothetical protein [Anaerolineae bacterium]